MAEFKGNERAARARGGRVSARLGGGRALPGPLRAPGKERTER